MEGVCFNIDEMIGTEHYCKTCGKYFYKYDASIVRVCPFCEGKDIEQSRVFVRPGAVLHEAKRMEIEVGKIGV